MNGYTFKIHKKSCAKGEDGHKIFSIRIKEETLTALDELAVKSNRSRNELINMLLEHLVKNVEVVD